MKQRAPGRSDTPEFIGATFEESPCLRTDRRRGARYLPPVGKGRPTIGARVGLTENVSAGGIAVQANLDLGIGDNVPVKFPGSPVLGARIVWKRGALVGLALIGTAHDRKAN
jgi:hypothetical protein